MPLTDPLSERNPERWAVRFMAHAFLGLLAWHSLIWIIDPVWAALGVVVIYAGAWEALVQRIGAGWWDAALDTWAVALGAALGLNLLTGPNLWAFVGLMVAGGLTILNGVLWRR